ncbi:hypothetical protein BDP27DRAFT_1364257 [Rhodocollybia butyracea]|uniref:Uncharacterized protein n=1 Tax=Rhodocollybia butyracea TaxID=206335 RepID=A0A9P5PRS9_9AGAR|nr:hypothetical protein BDP27DRAFT_1364257 [Rhodocollybia butyracea]
MSYNQLDMAITQLAAWQRYIALNTSEDSTIVFELKQHTVALTIQSMKKITPLVFKTAEFTNAVAKSGLALTILKLSHPAYGYNHSQDPHHARLLRLHGFGLVLGDILARWTPEVWASEAGMLLSTWEQWLSWSLDAAGYRVYNVRVPDLYWNTMKYLKDLTGNAHNFSGIRETWDPTILLIVEETLLLRGFLEELDVHAHNPEVKHCSKCTEQPMEKRCVQHVNVTLNEEPEFISRWTGVGVSKVPTEQQMKPRREPKAMQSVAQIIHPDDIGTHGLKCIMADEEVLQRCGKQIFKLFRNNKLPSGGRRADHYTFYAGITAETYEGIIILFEQAKLSAMVMRTARAIRPELVNKINEQSKACERYGYYIESQANTLCLSAGVLIQDFFMAPCFRQRRQ